MMESEKQLEIAHLIYIMPSYQEFCWEMTKYTWEYCSIYLIYFLNYILLKMWIPDEFLILPSFYFVLFHAGVFMGLVWDRGLYFFLIFLMSAILREENYNTLQHSYYLSHMAKKISFSTREYLEQDHFSQRDHLWGCHSEVARTLKMLTGRDDILT